MDPARLIALPSSRRANLRLRSSGRMSYGDAALDFARALESMIDAHMAAGARGDRPARFRRTSRTEELEFRSGPLGSYLRSLGAELREGVRSPRALAGWGESLFGVAPEDTLAAIDTVWRSGALDAGP